MGHVHLQRPVFPLDLGPPLCIWSWIKHICVSIELISPWHPCPVPTTPLVGTRGHRWIEQDSFGDPSVVGTDTSECVLGIVVVMGVIWEYWMGLG